jgi:hypothetical protein
VVFIYFSFYRIFAVSKYEDELNEILNTTPHAIKIPSELVEVFTELQEKLTKTKELLAMANQCDRGQVLKKHLKLCNSLLKSIGCLDCSREFKASINELKELYEHDSDNNNKGYV